jgi:hypothetical protein
MSSEREQREIKEKIEGKIFFHETAIYKLSSEIDSLQKEAQKAMKENPLRIEMLKKITGKKLEALKRHTYELNKWDTYNLLLIRNEINAHSIKFTLQNKKLADEILKEYKEIESKLESDECVSVIDENQELIEKANEVDRIIASLSTRVEEEKDDSFWDEILNDEKSCSTKEIPKESPKEVKKEGEKKKKKKTAVKERVGIKL